MNRNPHKKTLDTLFGILISVLLFGCESTTEHRLLIISSQQSKGNLVNDKISRLAHSSNYFLKKSENITSVHEDTLKLFSNIFFNYIELNDLNHFQINALERYVDSGGSVVIIEPTDTDYNQYKWPRFHKLFSRILPSARQLKADLTSSTFGKGQVVLAKLEHLELEAQKRVISKAITNGLAHPVSLEYENLPTSLIPPDHWFEIDTLVMSFD